MHLRNWKQDKSMSHSVRPFGHQNVLLNSFSLIMYNIMQRSMLMIDYPISLFIYIFVLYICKTEGLSESCIAGFVGSFPTNLKDRPAVICLYKKLDRSSFRFQLGPTCFSMCALVCLSVFCFRL